MGAGVGRDLRRDVFRRVTYFTTGESDQFSTISSSHRTTNDITQVQTFLHGPAPDVFAPIMGHWRAYYGAFQVRVHGVDSAFGADCDAGRYSGVVHSGAAALQENAAVHRQAEPGQPRASLADGLRAFATQDFEQKRFDKANKDLTSNTLFVNRAMVTMMPVMTLVMNGVSLLIVWVGGHQIAQSTMQVGDMMAFIQYAMQVIMSFCLSA